MHGAHILGVLVLLRQQDQTFRSFHLLPKHSLRRLISQ